MTYDNITQQMRDETERVLDRGVITRGQRLVIAALLRDAAAEIERLNDWRNEATEVLGAWDGVWMIAGQPGRLGASKAKNVGDYIQRLRSENEAWMNGVADVVEPLGYDRGAACGPSDLLPGLTELRNHGMEMARGLHDAVEALSRLQGEKVVTEPVAHSVFLQQGSNLCVCGESTESVVHQANQEHNPFDEHTRMWEDEIRGMGLNPDVVRKVAEKAKPYVDIPFSQ